MKKQELILKAGEITKDVIRGGNVDGPADVLELVPETLSSVVVDRGYIKSCIERELNRSTANPINALLKLIGLRIVRTRAEIDGLSDAITEGRGVELRQSGNGDLDSFLMLDADVLRSAIMKMADALSRTERERCEEREAEREKYELAHGELTRASARAEQLTADLADIRKTVAERAQYMLGHAGQGASSPEIDQLLELLDDLDMKVYWDASQAPFTESSMFSVLKVPDLTGRRPRPCVVWSGTVLAKGLKFVVEPSAAPDNE